MKPRIVLLTLAIGFFALAAHSQDIITATIGNRACGPASAPLYCTGISAVLAGDATSTATFDLHTIDPRLDAQWIKFYGSLSPLGQATIATEVDTKAIVRSAGHTATEVTSITAAFHGNGYTGAIQISFGYYYAPSGRSAGWKRVVSGGTISVQTAPLPSGLSSTTSAMSAGPVGQISYCGGGTSGYWEVGYAGYGPLAKPYKVCSYYNQYYGPRIAITWNYYYWFLLANPFTDVGN